MVLLSTSIYLWHKDTQRWKTYKVRSPCLHNEIPSVISESTANTHQLGVQLPFKHPLSVPPSLRLPPSLLPSLPLSCTTLTHTQCACAWGGWQSTGAECPGRGHTKRLALGSGRVSLGSTSGPCACDTPCLPPTNILLGINKSPLGFKHPLD